MSVKVIKIVGNFRQGDIKFGSNETALSAQGKALYQPPIGLLVHLGLPTQCRKRDQFMAQGKLKEAMSVTGNVGYLRFSKQKAEEVIGAIDPALSGQFVKTASLVYNPEKSTLKQFVEGINWLHNFITVNRKPGVIEENTNIYIFEDYVPSLMTRPLTVEDFSDESLVDVSLGQEGDVKTARPKRRKF